jgi:hypothetical protein
MRDILRVSVEVNNCTYERGSNRELEKIYV